MLEQQEHHHPYEISDMTKFHKNEMSKREQDRYEELMRKTVHALKELATQQGLDAHKYTEKDELVKDIIKVQSN